MISSRLASSPRRRGSILRVREVTGYGFPPSRERPKRNGTIHPDSVSDGHESVFVDRLAAMSGEKLACKYGKKERWREHRICRARRDGRRHRAAPDGGR